MALTAVQIDSIKPEQKKKKVSDGGGLYVEVLPSGRKTFRLVYRFSGKQKDVRIGRVGHMRLAEARSLREIAKSMLDRGEDPAEVIAKGRPEPSPSAPEPRERPDAWAEIASQYLGHRKRRGAHWRTLAKLERQIAQTVEFFGDKPVVEVTAADILELVRPIEDSGKVEAAHEVRSRCAQILDYAEAVGFPNTNPARKISGAMMPRRRGSWPGLTEPQDVGKLMRDIRAFQNCEPETRWGLLLSAYLFPRSEQLRGATWSEIDLDAALWEIPGERMKGADAVDHLVPLPRQVIALLGEIADYTGGIGYVVPSPRGVNRKLSEAAFNMALRRLGYCTKTQHCHHGFRTTASTSLNEMGFNRDWIERQLSHVEQNKVRSAYNKAQYIEGRTEMMQTYADWLDSVSRER
jgi:integrase